jgi:hypothetical protein
MINLTVQDALLDQLLRGGSGGELLIQLVLITMVSLESGAPRVSGVLTPSMDFSSSAFLPARLSPGSPDEWFLVSSERGMSHM